MIGLEKLIARIAQWSDEEILLWLSRGVAAAAVPGDPDSDTLVFRPLLLSRSEPPLQQLHFALDRLDRVDFERVRFALARLLAAWRTSDDPRFVQALWSLAVSLKPPAGVIEAANHLVGRIDQNDALGDRFAVCVETIVVAVLGFPRTDQQDRFMGNLRRTGLWTRAMARHHVLHLVRDDRSRWLDWVKMYARELDSPGALPKGFARQLIHAVGGDLIFSGIAYRTFEDDLFWLRTALMPLLEARQRWDGIEVSIGEKTWVVATIDGWAFDDPQICEQYFDYIGRAGIAPLGDEQHRLEIMVANLGNKRIGLQ